MASEFVGKVVPDASWLRVDTTDSAIERQMVAP